MPELFGSAYILPVIIVVVLLLVLLLVLMIKRRRSETHGNTARTQEVAAPTDRSVPNEQAQEASVAASATNRSAEAAAQPAAQTTAAASAHGSDQRLKAAKSAKPGRSSEHVEPVEDPLKAVIVDIVHGWGELTSEDTNRLDLFRPDKVLAASEAIELPKEDAGGGNARSRLLGIRKYAADKEKARKSLGEASPAKLESSEPTADSESSHPNTHTSTASELKGRGITERSSGSLWEAPSPNGDSGGAGLAAGTGLATVGLASAAGRRAEEGEPAEDRESLEKSLPDSESEWSAPEPVATTPWPEASQSAAPQLGEQQPSEPRPPELQSEVARPEEPAATKEPESGEQLAGIGGTPSLWAQAPAGWDVQEPVKLEEAPIQLETETHFASAAAVGGMERPASDQDITARLQSSEDSLSSLHGRVRTADDLMGLPPEEQADMLAFLEPPELARVLERSEERKLKKSVIDVLENLGSPASLDVLRRCLDDPDQEIQLYALDAADRLLGEE